MRRHSIVIRLNLADKKKVSVKELRSTVTTIHFIDGFQQLGHGIGQIVDQLARRAIYPTETALDLALLAAAVTAADTRISRQSESQDSWTREIDLYLPVSDPTLWAANTALLERMLAFLTGDRWRVFFRARPAGLKTLIKKPNQLLGSPFKTVCLFSGGLDSFVGAIDLLEAKEPVLFVSHYWDVSTSSQMPCAHILGAVYGDLEPRHVRARVGFPRGLVKGSKEEKTTRGRSFLFFALAALAASGLDGLSPFYVPENGLISLNVPLDPLRIGAWSTRTTHPFYMARWQELLGELGIEANLVNPYRFETKGEMLSDCSNKKLLKQHLDETISCSSYTKARWKKGQSLSHCGYCTPCLIRRAAIPAAFGNDPTPYTLTDLAAHPLDPKKAEAADVRSFQMMYQRLKQSPGLAKILVHKTGSLADHPDKDVTQYASVFQRGISEVGTILKTVVV